jgi:predicted transcriptional regulator of viral defense system
VVSVGEAAGAWGVPTRTAALKLATLAKDGWLVHIRRGFYFVPPLEAGEHPVAEDPWILGEALFAPCYVGGWSAAEHWGLTEQLFRSTFMATAANIRRREQTLLGTTFRLVRVSRARVESVKPIWRGRHRVRVSSPERTLVDALMAPSWVGGVRHLTDMLTAYRDLPGSSVTLLSSELGKHGNGAAHKRAGFLAERTWPDAAELIAAAAGGRSSGVIRLDPDASGRGRMNRRWGLWINVGVPEVRE